MTRRILQGITVMAAFTVGVQAQTGASLSYKIECLDCASEEISHLAESGPSPSYLSPYTTDLDAFEMAVGSVFRVGKQVWSIVEANRPAASVRDAEISVLPAQNIPWQSLSGWQLPQTRSFRMLFRNGYRVPVITFQYRVQYTSGGSFNGRGAYLARVTVVPEQVTVMGGYTFDAEVSVPSILNMGTVDAPVAGAEVQVKWRVRTVLMDSRHEASFFVDGRGGFRQLSAGN